MWNRFLTHLVVRMLKNSRLSYENRSVLISGILSELNSFPIGAILSEDGQGGILLKGEPLKVEDAVNLREGAKALLHSNVRQLIRDQVAFQAIAIGIHTGDTPERVYFSKVALWWGLEEEKLVRLLAQE